MKPGPFSSPSPPPPPPNIIRADAARLHGTRDATGAVNELEHAKSAATTIEMEAWRRSRLELDDEIEPLDR